MMNWTMIGLRGSALPAVFAFGGLAIAIAFSKLSVVAPGAVRFSFLAMGAGLLLAGISYGVFIHRLFRWERGAWRECRRCGGPLGWLRQGKRYYGKQLDDYRRCYNCGQATPETAVS